MIELRTLEPTMRAALRDLSWGAVPPYENVEGTVSLVAQPSTADYHVCLRVRAKPMKRILYLGGDRNKALTIPASILSVESRAVITSRDLRYAASDNILNALVADAIKYAVRGAAPRLYEADPRIGSCDRSYPPLPLFDPPNGVDAMRRIHGCPLCGEERPDPGGAGYRAWGGGNLGWVHPSCLADVYP